MAQKRKRKNNKHVYVIIMLVLLLVAGLVTYFVWNTYFDKKADGGNKQEETSVEDKDEKKNEGKGSTDVKETREVVEKEKEKEQVMTYEGDNPNNADELTGVVTYAGVSPDGGELVIRVNIDQYLGNGNCELNLVQGGVVYKDTASIAASASTATCEGFNVSTVGLSGNYSIVIYLNSGGKTGTINGEVNI